ncbi:hypothetical protein KY321_03655 [Candidatus Woesearchaeota archaeon]|nr:hypothetical protein [Candidatus Woesearchaeota archaeon]
MKKILNDIKEFILNEDGKISKKSIIKFSLILSSILIMSKSVFSGGDDPFQEREYEGYWTVDNSDGKETITPHFRSWND